MTDDEILSLYGRIKAILPDLSFHGIVLVIADLSTERYGRVHAVCIEED